MESSSIFTGESHIKCCTYLARPHLYFQNDMLGFCCKALSNFNPNAPRFPYLDTATETIVNFLHKRVIILAELNGISPIDIAKACADCDKLGTYPKDNNNKVKHINISCYPSVCNAKCIYCSVYTNPKNTFDSTKHSRYPKMISEIISWLQSEDLIEDNASVVIAPAEITIMPHKDLLLDSIARYKANFLSNGFIFDQKIADTMKRNGSQLMVSIDSGTRETFKFVKGLDLFEKVKANLKKYKIYGNITIKFIVIAGVNDSNNDLDGIIDIVCSLGIRNLHTSFEYGLPLRSAFFSLTKLIDKLDNNGLSFSFHAVYSPEQIRDAKEQYITSDSIISYEKNLSSLRSAVNADFIDDYKSYRRYAFYMEIKFLLMHFKSNIRFALLGFVEKDQYIIFAFEKLGIPLLAPNVSYEESFELVKDYADVFIIRSKEEVEAVKSYMESADCNSNRLLDIERYYYSFEPARLYLERHIAKEFLQEAELIAEADNG